MTKYTLTLSKKQAYVLQEALETYSRIAMGQLDVIHMMSKKHDNRQLVDDMLDWVGTLSGLKPNDGFPGSYYGIKDDEHVSADARIAWDIHQVVRHRLAWDRTPEGGIQVCFDEPMVTCYEEPLAKMALT